MVHYKQISIEKQTLLLFLLGKKGKPDSSDDRRWRHLLIYFRKLCQYFRPSFNAVDLQVR